MVVLIVLVVLAFLHSTVGGHFGTRPDPFREKQRVYAVDGRYLCISDIKSNRSYDIGPGYDCEVQVNASASDFNFIGIMESATEHEFAF